MIFLSFPLFFNNIKLNNLIEKYTRLYPERLNFSFKIFSNHGNLPYTPWNGDGNNNAGDIVLHNALQVLPSSFNNSVILNCSNIYLNENDYFNNYMKTVLSHFNLGSNYIELSSLSLYEYLNKETEFEYNYIFSENSDLLFPITHEILNTIFQQENFKYFIMPQRLYKNIDFLKNNKHKNKTIIKISKCFECQNYLKCKKNDSLNQYNYSSNGIQKNCKEKIKNYSEYFNEQKKYYEDLGYKYFMLDTPPTSAVEREEYVDIITSIIIKPEYKYDFLKEYMYNG